jgi:lysophospholipase L1-like esterase
VSRIDPASDPPRPPAAGVALPARLAVLLVLLAGWVAWSLDFARSGAATPANQMAGSFWTLESKPGSATTPSLAGSGLFLGPGGVLRLADADGPDTRLERIVLEVEPAGAQSGYVRLRLRDRGASAYQVFLVGRTKLQASLSRLTDTDDVLLLDKSSVSRDEGRAAARSTIELGIDGGHFAVGLDGEPILEAEDTQLRNGRCNIYADGVNVLSLLVAGHARVDGVDVPFERREDFTAPSEQPGAAGATLDAGRLVLGAAIGLLALVACWLWLRALCLGDPPATRVWLAAGVALAPLALFLAARGALQADWPAGLGVVTFLAGLPLACLVLRAYVAGAEVRSGRLRPALVVAALVLLACGAVVRQAWLADQAASVEVPGSATARDVSSYELEQAQRLDAASALAVPGQYRNLLLRAQLVIEPESWVEVRLRGDREVAAGVALFLSTRGDVESGFWFEDVDRFERLGEGGGRVAAGVPLDLELRATGARLSASVNGQPLASAVEARRPAGLVRLLPARGVVTVQSLSIEPLPDSDEGAAPAVGVPRAAFVPPLLLLALGALATWLLRLPPLRAAEMMAFALLAVAAGYALAEPEAAPHEGGVLPGLPFVVASAGAGLAVLLPALLHARRAGALRTGVFLLLALPAAPAALWLLAGPPPLPEEALAWDTFAGERLSPELTHLLHPKLRRLNKYLLDHRFRGQEVSLEKPAGARRVLCIGSSSTWGHGIDEALPLDYPSVLQELLAEQLPGTPVEVLNAGVRDATSARLLRFLREVLLDFQPDVVTVSLTYNDSIYVSQFDEERYLQRITSPDFSNGWLEHWQLQRELTRGKELTRDFVARVRAKGQDTEDGEALWHSLGADPAERTPPQRFGENLRAMAELLAAQGVDLVLIQEPLRGGLPAPWVREFHAVIAEVGEEFSVPVVNPTPALQAAGGGTLFMDAVHPLPAGHAVIAAELLPVVEELFRERQAQGR